MPTHRRLPGEPMTPDRSTKHGAAGTNPRRRKRTQLGSHTAHTLYTNTARNIAFPTPPCVPTAPIPLNLEVVCSHEAWTRDGKRVGGTHSAFLLLPRICGNNPFCCRCHAVKFTRPGTSPTHVCATELHTPALVEAVVKLENAAAQCRRRLLERLTSEANGRVSAWQDQSPRWRRNQMQAESNKSPDSSHEESTSCWSAAFAPGQHGTTPSSSFSRAASKSTANSACCKTSLACDGLVGPVALPPEALGKPDPSGKSTRQNGCRSRYASTMSSLMSSAEIAGVCRNAQLAAAAMSSSNACSSRVGVTARKETRLERCPTPKPTRTIRCGKARCAPARAEPDAVPQPEPRAEQVRGVMVARSGHGTQRSPQRRSMSVGRPNTRRFPDWSWHACWAKHPACRKLNV